MLSGQARKERGGGDGHVGGRTVSTSIVLYADGDTTETLALVMWHPGANANVSHVIDLHAQYFFFQPLLSSIVLARMVGLLLPAHPLTSQETEGYVY